MKHIAILLEHHRAWRHRLIQTRIEQARDDRLRAALPQPLRSHCSEARLEDGQLTLWVDSPAWATRARFLQPQLPPAGEESIARLRIRVRPPSVMARLETGIARRRLSATAGAHLRAAAGGFEDLRLAAALRRLALHAEHPGLPPREATARVAS